MAARPYVVVDSDDPEKLVAYLVQSATSQSQARLRVGIDRQGARAPARMRLPVIFRCLRLFGRAVTNPKFVA